MATTQHTLRQEQTRQWLWECTNNMLEDDDPDITAKTYRLLVHALEPLLLEHQKFCPVEESLNQEHGHATDYERMTNNVLLWLTSAQRRKAPFLQKRMANGRPSRFSNFQSMDQAESIAQNETRQWRKEFARVADKQDSIKTVMEFDNGWHIVRLLTPHALRREGGYMKHCAGDGLYDIPLQNEGIHFYSLRSKKNKPHATLDIDPDDNVLLNCKGKGDQPPAAKYMRYIEKFVQQEKCSLYDEPADIHLIDINGIAYDIFRLPIHIKGNLSLYDCINLRKLTEGITVTGYLDLLGCDNLIPPKEAYIGKHVIMPDGTVFPGKDWNKERADWMQKNEIEEEPSTPSPQSYPAPSSAPISQI